LIKGWSAKGAALVFLDGAVIFNAAPSALLDY
jgi:hypothetical protein